MALLFSVQRRASVISPESATAGGSGPMQIVWDVFRVRFDAGPWSLALFIVPLLCSV
jgi:hypothetical protein